jgi:hypothetical protein
MNTPDDLDDIYDKPKQGIGLFNWVAFGIILAMAIAVFLYIRSTMVQLDVQRVGSPEASPLTK